MFKLRVIYYVILFLHVCLLSAEISDKRLCANKECTVAISLAETIRRYGSDDKRILSFKEREVVTIYSKSAGKKPSLWGGEINGKRGYLPVSHLKEYKILTPKSNLSFEVDTEEISGDSSVKSETLSPDPVQTPYEIIDGTKIYLNNAEIVSENSITPENLNDKPTEPTPPIPTNESTEETEDAVQAEHSKNKDEKEASVVGNVLSSFTNWMQDGSGLTILQNEEIDENADSDDIEIETDDDHIINNNVELNVADKSESEIPLATEDILNSKIISEDKTLSDKPQEASVQSSSTNTYQKLYAQSADLKTIHSANTIVGTLEKVVPTVKAENEVTPNELPKFATQEKEVPILNPLHMEIDISPLSKEIKQEQAIVIGNEKQSETTTILPSEQGTKNVNIESHTVPMVSNKLDSSKGSTVNILNEVETNDHDHVKNESEIQNELGGIESLSENQVPDDKQAQITEKPEINDSTKESQDTSSLQGSIEKSNLDVATKEPFFTLDVNQSESENDESSHFGKDAVTRNGNIEFPTASIKHHSQNNAEYVNPVRSEDLNHHVKSSFGLFEKAPASSQTVDSVTENNVVEKYVDSIIGETGTIADKDEPIISDDNSSQNVVFQNNVYLETSSDNVEKGSISNERSDILSDTSVTQDSLENSRSNIIAAEESHQQSFDHKHIENVKNEEHLHHSDAVLSKAQFKDHESCEAGFYESACPNDDTISPPLTKNTNGNIVDFYYFKLPVFAYEVFLILIISAVTVVIFLWGYIFIDRSRKEGPLVAKINNLHKQLLIFKKENELLSEKVSEVENDNISKAEVVSSEIVEDLKYQLSEAESIRASLEQQIQNLEKELENSTEVGLELNRMLSEFLNSDNGSDTLIANIDQLQRQLVEQQGTINNYNETLSMKETENHELRLELEINNSRVNELQSELNKMALNLMKLEEDKEQLQNNYETDISSLKEQLEGDANKQKAEITKISEELGLTKQKYEVCQRNLELKTNEYKLLKENISKVNSDNNNSDTLKSMFDATSTKAELIQLRNENQILNERLQQENSRTSAFEKQAYLAMEDAQLLKTKYDNADQERLEAQTKLEILSNYFKEREAQLQKELSKQESMWIEKQGEATSTVERIKYMQEELQNYKAQYESLKQEIVAQEVDMKSQISVLEKKAHENWVAARQAERKLEDAKQEAAQLRNRLTLRERSINDEKVQNRLVSPLEQNGDLSLNDTGSSLPLMFGTREHLTTSPPLPSLPHFLPPPGVPFMPPPLGGVPLPPPGFLPPPPSMIPGDHRPPPLGRMSSPPLNSRYSPDSMVYSPYNRNSPSPTSDDEYDRPVYRSYSPYNRDDRRDFRPPPPPPNRNSLRNHRGTHSSGSAQSNESLEKINRHNSKV